MNLDNFDSGSGVEDIVRDGIQSLIPKRYGVHALTITDRLGRSGGDFDIVVTNDYWFPSVKAGATASSRKVYFPIEGVYAIIEVKQTLTFKTLDDAMRKLVTGSRLRRPILGETRLTENRTERLHANTPLTLLYSAIIATSLDSNLSFDDLALRFIRINQQLERQHVVRSLTVLGNATMGWGTHEQQGVTTVASGRSFDSKWHPAKHIAANGRGALYPLISELYAHCNASVLPSEDIPAIYGTINLGVAAALSEDLALQPNQLPWHSYHKPDQDGEPIFLD
jgi:hypothetical protein